jgi:multiple sugar transport system ATP-binding protein
VATIALDRVSKVYPNGVKAVREACLEIGDGEFVVIVGPSGCGKSSTLRMIAGLDSLSSGSISIDGRRVDGLAPKDRDLAMVFQNYALYPHLTAYDNMAFGLKLRRHSKSEIDARVREAADILGISSEQLQRKPGTLSGGQRQRVAVGRAIVRQPKAFLFDEPLSNLDARMRVEMRAEISRLHRRLGATMIYVTHDQVEAMTMGDRIVVMRDGVIQQVDEPLGLYDRPRNAFVAGFIGSPPMNLFRGTLERRDHALWFVQADANGAHRFAVQSSEEMTGRLAPHAGRQVIFGVRPEDVRLAAESARTQAVGVLTATVEVVEPMGAETHLSLSTAGHGFVARTPERPRVKAGDATDVTFDMGKCHFFDAASEAAIE